jgi:acylphosphatase
VTTIRTVRLRIDGRVQGVGFRYWMEDEARELGVTGWVRNRRDGSVEAAISGDAALVEAMLARCRHGPPAARVGDVAVLAEEDGTYQGFDIKPTV